MSENKDISEDCTCTKCARNNKNLTYECKVDHGGVDEVLFERCVECRKYFCGDCCSVFSGVKHLDYCVLRLYVRQYEYYLPELFM
jgi:hypothetical protein